jgi:hypothetical protein
MVQSVPLPFASEGAEVFLAGRTAAGVEAVAKQIEAAAGRTAGGPLQLGREPAR